MIRTEDVDTEFLFDPEPCRQRGILSLVAVPIYHDGNIVGGLELYFDRLKGYAEQDIHTCQLMAGLVTEAIGRDADLKLKKSMASERSTMLAAIERLQPNLAALAGDPAAAAATASVVTGTTTKSPCWKCGNKLAAEEQFCGKCGAPRTGDTEPSSMQSKLASAWQMRQTSHEASAAAPSNGASPFHESARAHKHANQAGPEEHEDANSFVLQSLRHESAEGGSSRPHISDIDDDSIASPASSESQIDEDNPQGLATAVVKPEEAIVWSSAAKARDFLESVSAGKEPTALTRFWRSRRGDFYLAVAVILVLVVVRWGIWSNHSVGAQGRGNAVAGECESRQAARTGSRPFGLRQISLIAVGLADAPEPPAYRGNPDTQVWVDLHTALYYCPGSELYGKTVKGKYASQREAQLDQFESASRKACE